MKAENKIPMGSGIINTDVLKEEPKSVPQSGENEEALIKAIEFRANYIGPVLEEILQSHHERWNARIE